MPGAYTTSATEWRMLKRDYNVAEDIEVRTFGPESGSQYEAALREAFNFLRRQDDGRYSSRMKMRIAAAADDAENIRNGGSGTTSLPLVAVARRPYEFDPDTEVKRGGMVAALVCWPDEEGRLLLAVHRDKRREHIGLMLVTVVRHIGLDSLTAWVNQRNIVGQHFLLSTGLSPAGTNSSGGVCYRSEGTEDGREEQNIADFDELMVRPSRVSREWVQNVPASDNVAYSNG